VTLCFGRSSDVALHSRENTRQLAALDDWSFALLSERGLWCRGEQTLLWKLDETEGPYRIRSVFLRTSWLLR
jgi:hypothetical protein